MTDRITYPDSGVKLKKLNKDNVMTYADLLHVLESIDEEHLDMEVIIYDEEGNMFWPCYNFMQAEKDFELDDHTFEAGQPFFVMPQ